MFCRVVSRRVVSGIFASSGNRKQNKSTYVRWLLSSFFIATKHVIIIIIKYRRGAINGNEYSGWLVMNLSNVKEGIIIIKLHTWYYPTENTKTEGWTSVNDWRNKSKQKKNGGGTGTGTKTATTATKEGTKTATKQPKGTQKKAGTKKAGNNGGNKRRLNENGHEGKRNYIQTGLRGQYQQREQPYEFINATTTDEEATVPQFSDKNYMDMSMSDIMTMEEFGHDDNEYNIINATTTTTSSPGRRKLKMRDYTTSELPETFLFQYAIDGEIMTLNRDEFLSKKQSIQRVVETLTLLDDENFITDKDGRDVEVAIRMIYCRRACTFGISHIYWA